MRPVVLALAASSLAIAACGKEEATGNTSAADQTLTAEDFATADTTAIDAATGAAANMAADVEFNALENADGNGADRPASGPARARPAPAAAGEDSEEGAQAPAEQAEPAEPAAESNAN